MYSFSWIRSNSEATKHYFQEGGEAKRQKTTNISSGELETMQVENAEEFAAFLTCLGPCDVLLYGLSGFNKIKITTKELYARLSEKEKTYFIPRAKTHIDFAPRPGIMCLDYDPEDEHDVLTHGQLLKILYAACPALQDAPMVLTHSASSYIYNGIDMLRGPKGKRVYILVQDAYDIHRAMMQLYWRIVIQGYIWFKKSNGGSLLRRSLIDLAMRSPVQVDYAAGAICDSPLEQRRPTPQAINNECPPLDTRTAIPDLTREEQEQATRLDDEAKAAVGMPNRARSREAIESTRSVPTGHYQRGRMLRGDTMIETTSGTFSWWHIMQHPRIFDKMSCIDPFHVSRTGDLKDGVIHADTHPGIASFAHGGTFYHSERVLSRPASDEQPRPSVIKSGRLGRLPAGRLAK